MNRLSSLDTESSGGDTGEVRGVESGFLSCRIDFSAGAGG